jgi:hypothetical protein
MSRPSYDSCPINLTRTEQRRQLQPFWVGWCCVCRVSAANAAATAVAITTTAVAGRGHGQGLHHVVPRPRQRVETLPLLVFRRLGAKDVQTCPPANHLAVLAKQLDGGAHLRMKGMHEELRAGGEERGARLTATVFAAEVRIARVGASDEHCGIHPNASNLIAGLYLHCGHACPWSVVGKWGTGDKGKVQLRQTALLFCTTRESTAECTYLTEFLTRGLPDARE